MSPRYDYLCRECGHEYEYDAKYDDSDKCPHCGPDSRVERLVSLPAGYKMNSGGSSTAPRQTMKTSKRQKA